MAERLTRKKIDETPDATDQDVFDHEAYLQELARLSPVAYDQCRAAAATRLNIRTRTLDEEVRKRQRPPTHQDAQGSAVAFQDPEPWLFPVAGRDLLEDLSTLFVRHLALPIGGAETLALWTLHAYTYDAGNITPRLGITSPQKRCGKTRVLEMLSLLTPRVLITSNATTAAIFRAIELWRPTLLIDEADTVLPNNEELRGILNSGHTRRTAYVTRTVGENHDVRQFSTWAPVAIALIGTLPSTLADRSIVLTMRRKKPDEQVESLPQDDDTPAFLDLRQRCARWAQDNFETLRECHPTVPEWLNDRAADNWRPLCAIAEVAGGKWPDRMRQSIQALTPTTTEDEEIGILLLHDMQRLFHDQQTDRIFSEDLAKALCEMEERPWPEYGKQRKPITPPQIARILKPFEIRPKQIRIGTAAGKGYLLVDCQEVFARYIPPIQTETPKQTSNGAGFSDFRTETCADDVSVRKSRKPAPEATCFGVSVSKGGAYTHIHTSPPPKGIETDQDTEVF